MSAIPIVTSQDPLSSLMEKIDGLAVLPHVVFKVLELTDSLESPLHEMERAITVDPGFSSKVLVMANSAYFGLPRRVTSIKESLLFLGFKTVRNLAMTVGVFDLFVGKTDRESLRRRQWWRRSVDAAVCARWLASKNKSLHVDDSYTCALLHLIGKTLMDRYGGKDYNPIVELTEKGVPDLLAEQKLYGFTHIEVAAAAAAKWGFPSSLSAGLDYTEPNEANLEFRGQRACTALASAIAATITNKSGDATSLPAWALVELGYDPTDCHDLLEQATAAISAAQLQM
jgi:HD-like signal output (HDOD) protein